MKGDNEEMKRKVFEEQTAFFGIGGDEKMASGSLMKFWNMVYFMVVVDCS